MSKTIDIPLVHVLIDRGSEVLNEHVPEHEVRVLQAAHGLDAVQAIGESNDTIALDDNADAEYARLERKYRRINAADPVRIAYPVGASQLADAGFKLGRGEVEKAPQSGARTRKAPQSDTKTDKK